jgi:hypothetical protein
MTQKQRLLRMGFRACEAEAALAALGEGAGLDALGHWIARMQIVEICVRAGLLVEPAASGN